MESSISERPPGRREARKQSRRHAIVAAARRSFLEDGYAATSMSGLLTSLGGSKATLWSYFRSKEELFAAVIDDVTAQFRQELESGLLRSGPLRETLVSFCGGFMKKTAEPDAIDTWRLILGESGRFPELGGIFYETVARRVEVALAETIQVRIDEDELRDEDANRMAQFLISLCTTEHNRRLWGLALAQDDEIDADAVRFADYFLRLFSKSDDRA